MFNSKEFMEEISSKLIADEVLDEIRDLNLKEFAEAMGDQLVRSGRSWMTYKNGGERTPSVAITPEIPIWRDFSQNISGRDALSYFAYRQWNDTSIKGDRFKIAVHAVCEIAGITVKYQDGSSRINNGPKKVSKMDNYVDQDLDKKSNDDRLDLFYRKLLSLCKLSKEHEDHLLHVRKLSKEEIEVKGYKSMPVYPSDRIAITKKIIHQLGEPEGIPGFYLQEKDNGEKVWSMAGRTGILIPFRDQENRIVGLQIRVDNPYIIDVFGPLKVEIKDDHVSIYDKNSQSLIWEGGRSELPYRDQKGSVELRKGQKYLWFSSYSAPELKIIKGARIFPAPNHVSVPAHMIPIWHSSVNDIINPETVWLVEGPLKGDIACEYTHSLTLSTASVGAMQGMFEDILKIGPKRIILAPDADAQSKEDTVGKAVLNLIDKAVNFFDEHNIEVVLALWNEALGKGIDDLFHEERRPILLTYNKLTHRFVRLDNFQW